MVIGGNEELGAFLQLIYKKFHFGTEYTHI